MAALTGAVSPPSHNATSPGACAAALDPISLGSSGDPPGDCCVPGPAAAVPSPLLSSPQAPLSPPTPALTSLCSPSSQEQLLLPPPPKLRLCPDTRRGTISLVISPDDPADMRLLWSERAVSTQQQFTSIFGPDAGAEGSSSDVGQDFEGSELEMKLSPTRTKFRWACNCLCQNAQLFSSKLVHICSCLALVD